MKSKNIYRERNELQKKKEKQLRYSNALRRNRGLVIVTSIFMIISLINIYSASYYNIGMKNKYLFQHGLYIFLAIFVFMSSMQIDYRKINKPLIIRLLFLGVNIVFLGMLIFSNIAPRFVPRINGAIGWIRIPGIGSIQPAEIFKIVFIVILAQRLALSEKKGEKDGEILKKNLILPIVFTVYLLAQNDLGTLIHYYGIIIIMLFMSKIKGLYIGIVAGVGGITGFFTLVYIYLADIGEDGGYKLQRVKSFLTGLITNYYDSDKGYQVRQSLIGIGSGGILGKGYGNGIQKYSYLPEIHTDFIFASYSEEFGFVGVMFIIALSVTIFYLARGTALECENYFGKYLAIGIGGCIMLQFIINVSIAIGLIPVFGIPMPFMSFGGSSIMNLFISLGLIMNINKQMMNDIRDEAEDEEENKEENDK